MARPSTGRPTELELEILKVLWKRGPSTVRAVWEELSQRRSIGHNSVLKIMQIMRDKGIVLCDDSQRPQVYRPRQRQTTVLRQFARDMLNRVFDGSAEELVLHALDRKKATPEQLQQLQKLLERIEGDER